MVSEHWKSTFCVGRYPPENRRRQMNVTRKCHSEDETTLNYLFCATNRTKFANWLGETLSEEPGETAVKSNL